MKVLVDIHDKRWNKFVLDFEKIANAAVGNKYKDSEVSVILTNDKEIQQINKQYRNIDKPTNVLSFELGDDILLGDIYISIDTVEKEALEENISVPEHTAHMLVHGILHLLGYDHIVDSDAKIMEEKEIKILKKLGIKNPYSDNEFSHCNDASCCPVGGLISWMKKLKIKDNGFWQYFLYACFGAVASFGFAPFYQWWWTIVGIGGAYWLTVKNKNNCGFWRSLLSVSPFCAMYSLAMFWWVLHSIYVVPELTSQFAVWTIPGVFGLMLVGVFVFSWPFVAIACLRRNAAYRVFLFALMWVVVLWGREWLFTGFPWNPIANIAMQMPYLINSMAVWGALGLTFLIVGFIAGLVEVVRDVKSKNAWCACLLFSVLLLIGAVCGRFNVVQVYPVSDDEYKVIRIVQPAQQQQQKATHNREQALKNAEDNMRVLFELASQEGKPDLIVFPETSYPFTVLKSDFIPLAQALGTDIVIGATVFDDYNLYNSMLTVNKNGQIDTIYSKSHLVPFGEYSPLGILPSPVNLSAGNGAHLFKVQNFVFAPAICYEIIFSGDVIPYGSETPDAIINITNDNWFGRTPGAYQHLDMVRRYAIESGVPVVRANYSGISAFVLSDGNVILSLPIGESGVLDGFVWGAHNTLYRTLGMNFWMLIITLFAGMGLLVVRNKN